MYNIYRYIEKNILCKYYFAESKTILTQTTNIWILKLKLFSFIQIKKKLRNKLSYQVKSCMYVNLVHSLLSKVDSWSMHGQPFGRNFEITWITYSYTSCVFEPEHTPNLYPIWGSMDKIYPLYRKKTIQPSFVIAGKIMKSVFMKFAVTWNGK